jgi:hypothetical protein
VAKDDFKMGFTTNLYYLTLKTPYGTTYYPRVSGKALMDFPRKRAQDATDIAVRRIQRDRLRQERLDRMEEQPRVEFLKRRLERHNRLLLAKIAEAKGISIEQAREEIENGKD